MSGESKLVFHEADARAMAALFSEKATLVGNFIPDVNDAIASAVKDWTGESREVCDAALKRLEARGEALCTLLTSASEAMTKFTKKATRPRSRPSPISTPGFRSSFKE